MYPSEDAKRPLAHATSNNKNWLHQVKLPGFEPWSIQSWLPNVPTEDQLGYCVFLRWKLVIAQCIYTLKLEIAHSGPGNFSGDTTVYIQLTNISLNTWMSSEALRIAILLQKTCLSCCESCIQPTISAAKFRLSRILQQPARFKRNLLNINCSTTLHCGGLD